jgi:hypothetical protein
LIEGFAMRPAIKWRRSARIVILQHTSVAAAGGQIEDEVVLTDEPNHSPRIDAAPDMNNPSGDA